MLNRRLVVFESLGIVLAISIATLGGYSGTALAKEQCANTQVAPDGWQTINVNAGLTFGVSHLTDYLTGPRDSKLIVATNGAFIWRSDDGGCSFKRVFDIGSEYQPVPGVSNYYGEVKGLRVSRSQKTMLASVQGIENLAGYGIPVDIPLVFRSSDSGKSWHEVSSGLPATGRITDIQIAPSKEKVAYATVDRVDGDLERTQIYRTHDSGDSWERVGDLLSPDALLLGMTRPLTISSLAIDPRNEDHVLFGTNLGVRDSLDGGLSWTSSKGSSRFVRDISISSTDPSRVVAIQASDASAGGGDILVSNNGGGSFKKLRLSYCERRCVDSVAFKGDGLVVALAGESADVRSSSGPGGRWQELVVLPGRPGFYQVSATRDGWIYARLGGMAFAITRYDPKLDLLRRNGGHCQEFPDGRFACTIPIP